MRTQGKIWMGIDPGRTTGVAVWQSKMMAQPGKFLHLGSSRLLAMLDLLRHYKALADEHGVEFEAVIEEPSQIKGIYARHKAAAGDGEKQALLLKIATNVGMNQEHAKLLVEMCEAEGIKFTARPPVKAKKWTASDFKLFTGEAKGQNQHVRDAARLVFGL